MIYENIPIVVDINVNFFEINELLKTHKNWGETKMPCFSGGFHTETRNQVFQFYNGGPSVNWS